MPHLCELALGGVRSIGEKVKGAGQTSGIIPFIRVMDSLTLAISQGSLRRGSAAVYLDIHHPEIEEFLEIRKPSGDFNRRSLNLHHGINITDAFMEAVRDGKPFDLISPKNGEVRKTVDARNLWTKILEIRMQTGEPYLIFSDTVNRQMAPHQRDLGLKVKQSNLCAEIMLHTGRDHLGAVRRYGHDSPTAPTRVRHALCRGAQDPRQYAGGRPDRCRQDHLSVWHGRRVSRPPRCQSLCAGPS